VTNVLEDVAIKLLGVVNCYFSGHPEMAYYVLPKESFDPIVAILTRGFISIH
jgi:hypothetical protein